MRPPPPLFGQQMLAGMGMGVGMGFPQPGQQYGMGQPPVVQSGPPVPLRMVAPSLAAMLQQQQQQQPPPVSRMEEAAPPPIPPPPPPEEPELKRQKVDEVVLVPEAEFLARHPVRMRQLPSCRKSGGVRQCVSASVRQCVGLIDIGFPALVVMYAVGVECLQMRRMVMPSGSVSGCRAL